MQKKKFMQIIVTLEELYWEHFIILSSSSFSTLSSMVWVSPSFMPEKAVLFFFQNPLTHSIASYHFSSLKLVIPLALQSTILLSFSKTIMLEILFFSAFFHACQWERNSVVEQRKEIGSKSKKWILPKFLFSPFPLHSSLSRKVTLMFGSQITS